MDRKSRIHQHLHDCREDIKGMTEDEIILWCRDKGQDLEDNNTYDIELQKTRPIDFSTSVVARLDLNALILEVITAMLLDCSFSTFCRQDGQVTVGSESGLEYLKLLRLFTKML
jgi:hypothetical protein